MKEGGLSPQKQTTDVFMTSVVRLKGRKNEKLCCKILCKEGDGSLPCFCLGKRQGDVPSINQGTVP